MVPCPNRYLNVPEENKAQTIAIIIVNFIITMIISHSISIVIHDKTVTTVYVATGFIAVPHFGTQPPAVAIFPNKPLSI